LNQRENEEKEEKENKYFTFKICRLIDIQKLWNETIIFKIYKMADKKQDMVEQNSVFGQMRSTE